MTLRQSYGLRNVPSLLLLTAAAMVTISCASTHERWDERYRRLISEPTPAHWADGTVWTMHIAATPGQDAESFRLRVTLIPTGTCHSGDWFELQHVDIDPVSNLSAAKAAYSVNGRHLLLDFNAGWCDLGDICGELDGHVFRGETRGGPFSGLGSDYVARQVIGWRVE